MKRMSIVLKRGDWADVASLQESDRLVYCAVFLDALEEGYGDSVSGRLVDSATLAAELCLTKLGLDDK